MHTTYSNIQDNTHTKMNLSTVKWAHDYDSMLSNGWLNHKHWYKTDTTLIQMRSVRQFSYKSLMY